MKKLITTDLGGQPVYFKDFEYLQEQIRELAIAALGYSNQSIVTILSGCVSTISTDGYTISVTAGWAMYANEVFQVDAQAATGSTPNVCKWRIAETWDSRGLKAFKDVTVGNKNVYQVRKLTLGYYPAVSEGVLFIQSVYNNQSVNWAVLTLNDPQQYNWLHYRLNDRGKLELSGMVAVPTKTSAFGVLPVGFKPSTSIKTPVTINSFDGDYEIETGATATLTVSYTGELSINAEQFRELNPGEMLMIHINHTLHLSSYTEQ